MKTEYDYINPLHYRNYSLEVIDMMEAIYGVEATARYCEMTAFKYRMRAGTKPGNPAEQDLEKERWYLDKCKSLRSTHLSTGNERGPEKDEDILVSEQQASVWSNSIQIGGYHTFEEAQTAVPEGYRLPTREEFEYLTEETEYSFDRGTREGVFKFKSGFEVRLPAAGYRETSNGASFVRGVNGYYWASSANSNQLAWYARFNATDASLNAYYQPFGFSIRCVAKKSTRLT